MLYFYFEDVNNAPFFSNIGTTIDVLESVSSGTILHTITGDDIDSGASLLYTLDGVEPLTTASVFTFDPNGT